MDSYMKRDHPIDSIPIPEDHLDFFASLEPYFETDKYIFVHAGLKQDVELKNQKPKDLFWIRGNFTKSDYDFGKIVVFGHTPFPEPLIQPNKIGIDTGAVYGRKLTCLELPRIVFYYS